MNITLVCVESLKANKTDKRTVLADAKRARLTTHKNHLPLQGVLVMKDTVSLYLPSQVSGLFKIILAFTLSCCTRGLFSESHDCID